MMNPIRRVFLSTCMLAALTLPAQNALCETPPEKGFAVLVGTSLTDGGVEENHNDLELAYQTLIDNGYPAGNMSVLVGGGVVRTGLRRGRSCIRTREVR